METFVLVRFTRRTGKIDTTIECLGSARLKMWALHNTTKSKDSIIFNKETGNVVIYVTGTGDFPKVEKDCGNIEDYCKGLLEEVNKN